MKHNLFLYKNFSNLSKSLNSLELSFSVREYLIKQYARISFPITLKCGIAIIILLN